MIDNSAQRTDDWYRARLGMFTGSSVGKLMGNGRGENKVFTEKGLSYIQDVASERIMSQDVIDDDELFSTYRYQTEIVNRAISWGIEQELNAKDLYSNITHRNIVEVGSCKHKELPFFASSPDGFFYNADDEGKGVIEIKCPTLKTYLTYATSICDNASLKKVVPEYYWQCQAHMSCTGAEWCDFIAFCPFASRPIHIVRIDRDEDAITQMLERVTLANEEANKIVEKFKKEKLC